MKLSTVTACLALALPVSGGEAERNQGVEDQVLRPETAVLIPPECMLDSAYWTFARDAWFGFTLDLDRLVGWKGGRFLLGSLNRYGTNLESVIVPSAEDKRDREVQGQEVEFRTDVDTAVLEAKWLAEFHKRQMELVSGEDASGRYSLGAASSRWDFYQRFDGGLEDDSFGFYAHANQMLFPEDSGSDEGLTAFLAAGLYPETGLSRLPFHINAGLSYKGLIPGRKDDRTTFQITYGNLTDDYAKAMQLPGGLLSSSEKVLEFTHRFQLTGRSYVQPAVQWVIDPGGTGDIPDMVVVGARFGLTF